MQVVAAPPDAAELIASVQQLGHPRGDLLRRLLATIEWVQVPAGRRIFSEGEPADGMYVLFSGRVRFVLESAPTALIPWEVDPIAVFGEGALLTREGRSRTAVAVRDSLVARIPPAIFEDVMTASPEVAIATARRVAQRTVFPGVDNDARRRTDATVTFVSASVPTARLVPFREASAAAMGPSGRVMAYGKDRAAETLEAVRHSDRVVVVVDATDRLDVRPLMDMVLKDIDPIAAPALELLLIDQPPRTGAGPVTRWHRPGGFSHRLRAREGDAADLRRIGRHVSGRSVGLVLGGGGARGLAHIGVLRALAELDIAVDSVGGTSMGAIIGGQHAMGWSWDRVFEHNQKAWPKHRIRFEISFPTVSLFSGRRSKRMFDDSFGHLDIEDFRLPYFCTTVDLSAFRLAVHREGSAAQWICASASVPGLWPPVVDAVGHLHIDGGQLNNVPTDVMRDTHDGPIIAVDVHARQALMTVDPDSQPPIGLRHMFNRRQAGRFPTIAETFNRCALLGSLQHQETARNYADIYLTPDLGDVTFRAFDRIQQAAETGYQCALQALSGWTPP